MMRIAERRPTAVRVGLAGVALLAVTACSGAGQQAATGSLSASSASSVASPSRPATGSGSASSAVSGTPGGATGPAEVDRRVGLIVNASGRYRELIRGIVITVDGETAAARYGQSGGPTVTGNTYSVTKSVLSMLIGIAIADDSIASVDQTLGQLLPTYLPVMAPGVADVTMRQLLTMTGGIVSDGAANVGPTTDDWVSDILATPLEHPPGTFGYSSSSSHLLSAILTTATGRPVLDYAREKLFDPLGISSEPAATPVDPGSEYDAVPGFGWAVDPRGVTLGYSSLKVTPVEMAALGQLYLDGGQWQGVQIVPEAWVRESTQPIVSAGSGDLSYGYQWWIDTVDGHPQFSARGDYGQLIEVVPDLGLVAVVSANNGPASFYTTDLLDILAEQVIPVVEG